MALAETLPASFCDSQMQEGDLNKLLEGMPAVTLRDDMLHELVKWATSHFGGPAQALRHMVGSPDKKKHFGDWLMEQLPMDAMTEYWTPDKGIPYSDTTLLVGHASTFGFDSKTSSKPFPFANTCILLAQEMDKDGYVTQSEPLRCFHRSEADNGNQFSIGYVKGFARQSTFLFGCLAVYQTRQKMVDIFPKLCQTASKVYFHLENHTTLTSVALRNAQLSHRGSIRKAHCVITWVSKLLLLQANGVSDAASVIKQYNTGASSAGQLQGNKRVGILALLALPQTALEILVHTASALGEHSPWSEEAWANKKIMPGFTCQAVSPAKFEDTSIWDLPPITGLVIGGKS